ncbi:hypothetical protein HDU76_008431 [Blyttiomyces sp. JEL0837]|nr:hypothetical protein HDU76_008431 [Blyttiomyces sp. JEL0837]
MIKRVILQNPSQLVVHSSRFKRLSLKASFSTQSGNDQDQVESVAPSAITPPRRGRGTGGSSVKPTFTWSAGSAAPQKSNVPMTPSNVVMSTERKANAQSHDTKTKGDFSQEELKSGGSLKGSTVLLDAVPGDVFSADDEHSDRKNTKWTKKKPQSREIRDIPSDRDRGTQQRKGPKKLENLKKGGKNAAKFDKTKVERVSKDVIIPEGISVVNLGALLGVSYGSLASTMSRLGFEHTSSDYVLNSETASLIAMEYNFNPVVSTASRVELDFKARPEPEDWSSYPLRPPVVTIMGHVDHGKTTLLDTLRKSSVAAGEAGGITQHIGAFSVVLPSGKRITFLDTPGHAAFTAMRARGAQVTDIIVLVVAGDDGVMPQTVEAIHHSRSADVPLIVAINKCDKPGVNLSKVKEGLLRHEVVLEDYGGEIPAVEVSGLTGKGLDNLEETILAVAELADIRGDPAGPVEAVIVESKIQRGKGNTATIVVQRGTLKSGDILVAGTTWCKVRMLTDENGRMVKEAGPSMPIETIGWKDLPAAGDFVLQAKDEETAKTVVEHRKVTLDRSEIVKSIDEMNEKRLKEKQLQQQDDKNSVKDEEVKDGAKTLEIILKADVHGSLEALTDAIKGLPSHEVRVNIISSGVGPVTDSDIALAEATKARIVAFNVTLEKKIATAAGMKKIPILNHKVIYHLLDDLKESMADMLPPEEVIEVIGEADILQVFSINVKGKDPDFIAGCRIMTGKVLRSSNVRVIRAGEIIFDGKIKTFKHHKKDINEASKGLECGMAFEGFADFAAGDKVSGYTITHRRRKIQ